MSEPGGGLRPAAGTAEMLSAVRFQEELRRVMRYRPPLLVGDILDAAVRKIEQNPAFAQSRLLTRMLAALTYQQGEFRRAEIAAFDSDTLAMVITLMDTHAAGTSTREDWVRAVDAAKAAQLGAGG
jgi:hypothetical protein